jgi:guanine deaminase
MKMLKILCLFLLLLSPLLGEPVGVRGTFLDFVGDPWDFPGQEEKATRFVSDGLLVTDEGLIVDFGPYDTVSKRYPGLSTTVYADRVITPGFVDCHIHYPQSRVVAAYGQELLNWLQSYIFPEELKLAEPEYAAEIARFFFDETLRNGTTTVQSFCTTSPVSVDAFFTEASRRNARAIGGLTGADRKGAVPEAYLDTAESFYSDSKRLIEKWHGKDRNLYAITPRFAFGSTRAQLDKAGQLKREHPGCNINTHLSETPAEIRAVINLFPEATGYLDVYDKSGLVTKGFTGGHSVYLTEAEFQRIHDTDASVAFCPSSNSFLGSGLFALHSAKNPKRKIRVGLGTDMGAGNTFSIIQVLNDAYKVGMLNRLDLNGGLNPRLAHAEDAKRSKVSSLRGFYLATLGGAEALHLEKVIGSFDKGKEADFIVLDPRATEALALRAGEGEPETLDEVSHLLFGVMMLGDDRCVDVTYLAGQKAHSRE